MARDHARIQCAIWRDPEFVALSKDAQRLYMLLLSQPKLSLCGGLDYTPGRWAQMADDDTHEFVEAAAVELAEEGFVLVDDDAAELIIRSFVRHDGVCDSANLIQAMWKAWASLYSEQLRQAIVWELPDKAFERGFGEQKKDYEAPPEAIEMRAVEPLPTPLPNPSPRGSGKGSPTPVPSPYPSPPPQGSPKGSASPAVLPNVKSEEEEDPRLGECWTLLAQRDAQAYTDKGGVIRSRGFFTSAAENRRDIHHQRAVELLEQHPEWTAEQLADGIDAQGKASAEQQAMLSKMKRNEQRKSGDVCARCEGVGLAPDDNDLYVPCPECRPQDYAALGEAS